MSVICLMLLVPSRRTITRDIHVVYIEELSKLKTFIKKHSQRISLTTYTWTCIKQVNYMCLTVHFIDDEWKLQKRILNFCPIVGHKSEDVGKGVEKCLLEWGFDNIFTITVDNASSNNGAITYLTKIFDHWGTNLLGGKYMHVRCVAHIVNLIVQDGLKNKEEHLAISRIRGAVRYIRNSSARLQKFKECVASRKLDSKNLLCLDVPTRWNSTYLMLEAAITLKSAFDAYDDINFGYRTELSKGDGVPLSYDWERATLLSKFLRHFYYLTVRISGSLYVTSNNIFSEISEMDLLLKEWSESDDFELNAMGKRMKEKFVRYWGAIEKMNKDMFYEVILDPRRKNGFLNFSTESVYDDGIGNEKSLALKDQVKRDFEELFAKYKSDYATTTQACGMPSTGSIGSSTSLSSVASKSLIEKFNKRFGGKKSESSKSELDKYISGGLEDDHEEFDILA
ncbi:hypothetical protein ABFS83_12G035900 [Erythranthe nasuta]